MFSKTKYFFKTKKIIFSQNNLFIKNAKEKNNYPKTQKNSKKKNFTKKGPKNFTEQKLFRNK